MYVLDVCQKHWIRTFLTPSSVSSQKLFSIQILGRAIDPNMQHSTMILRVVRTNHSAPGYASQPHGTDRAVSLLAHHLPITGTPRHLL
jgi:hypothetical protein